MAKLTPELEELAHLENAMDRSYLESKESETDSSASTKSSYTNVPDSIVSVSRAKAEWDRQLDREFSELEDTIFRGTVELEEALNDMIWNKKQPVSNEINVKALELEDSNLRSTTEQEEDLEVIKIYKREPLENYNLRDGMEDKITNKQVHAVEEPSDKISNKFLELEEKNEPGTSKTNKMNAFSIQNKNKVIKQANEKDFYASQDRIFRKIMKLEEQRKSSGSLKSDNRNAAVIPKEDAIINKQVNESEYLVYQKKVERKILDFEDESGRWKKSEVPQTLKENEKTEVSIRNEGKIINKDEREITERQDRVLRAIDIEVELDVRQKSELVELADRYLISRDRIDTVDDRPEDKIINKHEEEKEILETQDKILRAALQLEDELEKKQNSELIKLMEHELISSCRIDTVDDRQAETCVPLMDEETVSIDLNDGDEGLKVEESQINATSKTDLRKNVRSLFSAKRTSVDILKRLRDGRNAAASKACSCCKSIGLFTSTLFLCSLYIAVLSIVPIAMVVIGSLYLEECTVQPYIPIYLVVGGAFGIFYNFISIFRQSGESASYNCFDGIINLFFFIWFILGCVWVYGVPSVEFYDTTDPYYCHKTCYNFAYWLFNVIFILFGALVGLVCCAGCCGACASV